MCRKIDSQKANHLQTVLRAFQNHLALVEPKLIVEVLEPRVRRGVTRFGNRVLNYFLYDLYLEIKFPSKIKSTTHVFNQSNFKTTLLSKLISSDDIY